MYITTIFAIAFLQLTLSKKVPSCYDVHEHLNAPLITAHECGESKFASSRVMGGNNAELGEFPWMARLFFRMDDMTENMCGGSIISEKYILTAAHCCVGTMSMELLFVRLGDYDNRTEEDCYRGRCAPRHIDIEVERIISHEEFHPRKLANDICLLRLKRPIMFTDYKSPICLPTSCEQQKASFLDEKLIAAGWGAIDDVPGRPREILQRLPLDTVSNKECRKVWKAEGQFVPPKTICAGTAVGEDVCGGDSGGPLMYRAPNDEYYITGLVSFGQPCYRENKDVMPGVYTRISGFLKWILDNIKP